MTDKKELFESRPVLPAVLALALPSVAAQIILVIYNVADTLFVGMTGSDARITAVTVAMPAFLFLSAISNLFGIGAASVIARSLGRGETERARRAAGFAFWGCLVLTLLYCLASALFADPFVDLLGGSNPAVHAETRRYLLITVSAGGLFASLGTLYAHILRAIGCAGQAGVSVSLGGILNVLLDPLFMFVLFPDGMEIVGAAVATALSNGVALLFAAAALTANRGRFRFSLRPSRALFSDRIPRDVFLVGIPACLMTLCENISYAVLDNLMADAGTAVQAGLGVAKKINMLAHCAVRGVSQGVLPLIAYNYASGARRRMKAAVRASLLLSVGFSLFCTGVFFLGSRFFVSLFIRGETPSLSYGSSFLRILCLGAPFSAFGYTVISFFQATGRGGRSLLLALMRKGLLDIPLMGLLRLAEPLFGPVSATPLTDVVCSLVAAVLFLAFLRRHGTDKPLSASRAKQS